MPCTERCLACGGAVFLKATVVTCTQEGCTFSRRGLPITQHLVIEALLKDRERRGYHRALEDMTSSLNTLEITCDEHRRSCVGDHT